MPGQKLSEMKCKPCEGIGAPLSAEDIGRWLRDVPGWQTNIERTGISREFNMKNFMAAVRFIGNIAVVAESEDHHPDIHLTGYRKLKVELSTHALKGLTQNDFIVAAKINELPAELKF